MKTALLTLVTTAASVASTDGAVFGQGPEAPDRPYDPWVFRCVLDERPRMLVIALHEELWLAYDGAACGLDKAMAGPVNFEGAVFTGGHGPQPTSTPPYYESKPAGHANWSLVDTDNAESHPVRFEGYVLDGEDTVTLRYGIAVSEGIGKDFRIEETPSWVGGEWVTWKREFRLSGLPPGWRLLHHWGAVPQGAELRWNGNHVESSAGRDVSGLEGYTLTMTYPELEQEVTVDQTPTDDEAAIQQEAE